MKRALPPEATVPAEAMDPRAAEDPRKPSASYGSDPCACIGGSARVNCIMKCQTVKSISGRRSTP
jgi:hypothetical protein